MAQNKDKEVVTKGNLAQNEERILSFWKEKEIFKKTLAKSAPKGDFIFYEGPPTANGRPGIHHLEARAFKDLIPRYKTMRGFRVARKAGWDTHGLPVELEVEKKLGLTSKKDIEAYSVAAFNAECKKSVWTYVDEWKEFTDRIGYFIDMENPYVTYAPDYIESVWSVLKRVHDDGLLYKDYKVVPWCPRCGTALSSHELAQGYETVKDLSIYAKFKVVGEENTFVLAWTTTPWTLPGNIALAVGEDIDYVKLNVVHKTEVVKEPLGLVVPRSQNRKIEFYLLAKSFYEKEKEFFEKNFAKHEQVEIVKGSELVGMRYEPLFPYLRDSLPSSDKDKSDKAWQVYSAPFVTTEDGTGIVHTAVMYGQDDFELGTKEGLPKFHLVDDTGHFIDGTGPFSRKFVKDEEVAIEIIKDLAHRGLLFKKEKYEHSYPFCWRCKTPLIYYARDSWYIRMSSLRDRLIAENKEINWEPDYIKEGRFGEWLREVKDWAISRERYWGTPLPIWMDEDGSKEVIGSVAELKKRIVHRGNHFIFLRHGESEHNVSGIVSCDVEDAYSLTEEGKKRIKEVAKEISGKNISAIYSSPYKRTHDSAVLLAESLGFDEGAIKVDERIVEYNFGVFSGKPIQEYFSYKENHNHPYDVQVDGGESYLEAKKRFGDFLYDIDSKHEGETIVVVTHGIGLESVSAIIEGADSTRSKDLLDTHSFLPGSMVSFDFVPLPRNENYELDLHKPYIDNVVLRSENGTTLKRVNEVVDVWFDSGCMPFAQHHYPFENKKWVDEAGFPADYISEAIDQTRGWFYTLHAVGVLMGKGKAYKNVICLGHVLDKNGQKMSKSRGNALSPWDLIHTYGVDPLRFWMYTVNQPGESKNFDERTVDEVVKKVFNLLQNVTSFYEMYAYESDKESNVATSEHVLDRWIVALLHKLAANVAKDLDAYKPLDGGRKIRDFIADLSQWYLRRSRDRFKSDAPEVSKGAIQTLRYVLCELSKVMAPFAPFFAESVYQVATKANAEESVHLESWPELKPLTGEEEQLLMDMEKTRLVASMALEARSKANIKVRQPLSKLTISNALVLNDDHLLGVLAEEINVKNIISGEIPKNEVLLDTAVTAQLRAEGEAREFMRVVQDLRKEKKLTAGQIVSIEVSATEEFSEILKNYESEIKRVCNIKQIFVNPIESENEQFGLISIV